MKSGAANPFIEPDAYEACVSERAAYFRNEWERQKKNPGSPEP